MEWLADWRISTSFKNVTICFVLHVWSCTAAKLFRFKIPVRNVMFDFLLFLCTWSSGMDVLLNVGNVCRTIFPKGNTQHCSILKFFNQTSTFHYLLQPILGAFCFLWCNSHSCCFLPVPEKIQARHTQFILHGLNISIWNWPWSSFSNSRAQACRPSVFCVLINLYSPSFHFLSSTCFHSVVHRFWSALMPFFCIPKKIKVYPSIQRQHQTSISCVLWNLLLTLMALFPLP